MLPVVLQDRWYQTEAISSIYNYYFVEQKTGNPLICLPTGAGKGFVIARLLQWIFSHWPNQRVIIATHVKELINQNYQKLLTVWPDAPAGIYSAGLKRKEYSYPITFAGRDSIVNVIRFFGHVDLFVIDEAHLLGPSDDGNYMKIITVLMRANPNMKIIGLTATAYRTGLGLLTNGPIFTDIIYDICNIEGFKRLFADYHLTPPRPKSMKNIIDTAGVSVGRDGDFSQNQLAAKIDEKITWAALNEALAGGQDRLCRLIFCAGVERAIMTNDMVKAFGLKTAVVHSKMSDGERDGIMNAYYAGELDTLVNNGIATTGLDVQRIDHIIDFQPTMSTGRHVQKMGRGMRPFEFDGWRKIDCLVSDHGGNTRRLGPIDDPWLPKQKRKTDGDAPVRVCPACNTYNHASARVCAFCGEVFEVSFKVNPKAFGDELIKSELPLHEWFPVSSVYYTQHIKRNAGPTDRPTIKATYACHTKRFTEFVGIESSVPFVKKKAQDWWKQRFPVAGFVPETVADAMRYIDKLVAPKRILVCTNKQFPSVEGYEY